MRPIRLELEGFLSHRDTVTLDLEGVGALAIVGENGAGKSSLVEAISWALFGRGRGKGPDDFITAGRTKVRVRFTFELDGTRYYVERQRESGARPKSNLALYAAQGKHEVRAWQDADDGPPRAVVPYWRYIGGDSIAESQDAIVNLLGMDADLWEATSFIGQGKADAFTQLRPAERTQLLADLLELDRYAELCDLAKAREREAIGRLEELDRHVAALEAARSDVDEVTEELAAVRAERDRLAEAKVGGEKELATVRERVSERERDRTELGVLRADRARARREVDVEAHDLGREGVRARQTYDDLGAQLSALRASAARRDAVRAQLDEAQSAEDAARVLSAAHVDAHSQAVAATRRLTAEMQEIDGRLAGLQRPGVGPSVCFTCGQDLDRARRTSLVTSLRRARAQVASDLAAQDADTLRDRMADEDRRAQRARTAVEQYAAALARIDADAGHIDALEHQLKLAGDAVNVLAERQEALDARRVAARDPSERERDLERQVDDAEGPRVDVWETYLREIASKSEALALQEGKLAASLERADEAAAELSNAREEIDRLRGRRDVLSILVEAFGRDGIPKLVIEAALPELEAEANRLLQQLTAGRFALRIESLRALKGGGLRESLDVIVADDVSDRPLEQLSGGERQCVDLALRISLARLLAHRAGRQIETLVIDEGFVALDVAHKQRTIAALHSLVAEFPTIVFITHDEALAEAFPARLLVERGEGSSVVTMEGTA